MDRMLYVAMTGAKNTMLAQAINNNNLANMNTTGFRADLALFQSLPIDGAGFPTRVNAVVAGTNVDMSSGPLMATGRGRTSVSELGTWKTLTCCPCPRLARSGRLCLPS